tara:strand:+ start:51 stop:623 length:573 start_codon:yes stop_codon:yes gene_type:complete
MNLLPYLFLVFIISGCAPMKTLYYSPVISGELSQSRSGCGGPKDKVRIDLLDDVYIQVRLKPYLIDEFSIHLSIYIPKDSNLKFESERFSLNSEWSTTANVKYIQKLIFDQDSTHGLKMLKLEPTTLLTNLDLDGNNDYEWYTVYFEPILKTENKIKLIFPKYKINNRLGTPIEIDFVLSEGTFIYPVNC